MTLTRTQMEVLDDTRASLFTLIEHSIISDEEYGDIMTVLYGYAGYGSYGDGEEALSGV